MRKTPTDAAGVTRRALYGMDDGWYDTYWCSEHPLAKPNRLIGVTRRLGIAIGATVARHFRWPARRHAGDQPPSAMRPGRMASVAMTNRD
jgi:hypothetical protein